MLQSIVLVLCILEKRTGTIHMPFALETCITQTVEGKRVLQAKPGLRGLLSCPKWKPRHWLLLVLDTKIWYVFCNVFCISASMWNQAAWFVFGLRDQRALSLTSCQPSGQPGVL